MEMMLLKCYTAIQLVPAVLAAHGWIVVAWLVLVLLFGRRVYCRFVCPLGLAQSLVRGFMGKRRICSRLDATVTKRGAKGVAPYQLVVRLVVLVAFLAVGLLGLGWQWLDPYAIASRAVCLSLRGAAVVAPYQDWVMVALGVVPFVVILLLAVLAGGRIWCNWVCPVGTILSLVGIRPWKGDTVKKCAGCEKCKKCFEKVEI